MTVDYLKNGRQSIATGALLAPVPVVLVTAATNVEETKSGLHFPDKTVMTAAWCGIVNTKPPMLSLSIRPERLSYERVKDSGEFVINLMTTAWAREVDYCGVKSGRQTDKFRDCGFHAQASVLRTAPQLEEAAVCIACRVRQCLSLGSHDLFIADIIDVSVDKQYILENGRVALEQADLLAYTHGVYTGLGAILGFFGFSLATDEVYERRMRTMCPEHHTKYAQVRQRERKRKCRGGDGRNV